MKNENQQIDNNDYIRLPRSLRELYLDKFLLLEEFIVLIWLWMKANPKIGKADTSYEALSKDFHEKFSKNKMNKIMLELKRKKLIWYPRQQGRRSSFNVDIQNYPLSGGGYRDLSDLFKNNSGRSDSNTNNPNPAEALAEVKEIQQKLKSNVLPLNKPRIDTQESELGRSRNNENEKENKNYKNRSVSSKEIGVDNFKSASSEEIECEAIAIYLGERKMNFILSALSKYGIEVVRKAHREVIKRQDVIKNRGAYFNRMVENFSKNEFDE